MTKNGKDSASEYNNLKFWKCEDNNTGCEKIQLNEMIKCWRCETK